MRRRPQLERLEERAMLAITVDSLADNLTVGDGLTTLREAVQMANANPDADVIDFAPSLTAAGSATIELSLGQMTITNPVTIDGPGWDKLTIDANGSTANQRRLFEINTDVNATIKDVTLTGGYVGSTSNGGAIYSQGNLTIDSAVVSGNSGQFGGAVFSNHAAATLRIVNSTLSENNGVHGGAITSKSDAPNSLIIERSSIVSNQAQNYGGLYLVGFSGGGTARIENSTFSGNEAQANGGAIQIGNVASQLTIINSTITENRVTGADANDSGGIRIASGALAPVLHNTIVAGNLSATASKHDVSGTLASASSYNLFGTNGPVLAGPGNERLAAGALLGLSPLSNYGGLTPTHVLLPGSPALDTGSNSAAVGIGGLPLTVDQRGYARLSGTVDKGASEWQRRSFTVQTDNYAAVAGKRDIAISSTGGNLVVTINGSVALNTPLYDDTELIVLGNSSAETNNVDNVVVTGTGTRTSINLFGGDDSINVSGFSGALSVDWGTNEEFGSTVRKTIVYQGVTYELRGDNGLYSGSSLWQREVDDAHVGASGALYLLHNFGWFGKRPPGTTSEWSVFGTNVVKYGVTSAETVYVLGNDNELRFGNTPSSMQSMTGVKDFHVTSAGTLYVLKTDGSFGKIPAGGSWTPTPGSFTKFSVAADETVYALRSDSYLLVNGAATYAATRDFHVGSDGRLYWLATSGTFASRAVGSQIWDHTAHDIVKFVVSPNGTIYTIRNDNWAQINGTDTWQDTKDVAVTRSGIVYWLSTSGKLERRIDTGGWVTVANGVESFTLGLGDLPQMVAIDLPQLDPAPGDFNGDGRPDTVSLDPVTGKVNVALTVGTSTTTSNWGTLPSAAWNEVLVGDFNGDGRDDIAGRHGSGSASRVVYALSESNRFRVIGSEDSTLASTATPWTEIYVGDFDGDGSDELLGWYPTITGGRTANRWEVLHFDEQMGARLDTANYDWGNALHTSSIVGTPITVGDVNRDGRDDLVRWSTSTSSWLVGLSTPAVGAANQFVQYDFGTWFNGHTTDGAKLIPDVDAAYQKLLDVFSEVYNTVELELYPGLMKGIEATAQTKAGNDWDQAALLVDRLEAAGFEADIAMGVVTMSGVKAAEWVGTKNEVAAFNVIKGTLDANAVPINGAESIRFKHAWVRAKVPTATGYVWADLDPSWKFKDRQPGIPVDLTNVTPTGYTPVNGRAGRGTFDEFGYFQNAPVNQLPVEWYEDQVMNHLVSRGQNETMADVPFDGPIIQKDFTQSPIGWGLDATIFDSNALDGDDEVDQFDNLTFIASDVGLSEQFTHRTSVALGPETLDVTQTVARPHLSSSASSKTLTSTAIVNDYYSPPHQGGSASSANGVTTYHLEGSSFIAVPIQSGYAVTSRTRVRLDLTVVNPSNISDVWIAVGLDGNATFNTYTPSDQRDHRELAGVGTRTLDVAIGSLFSSTPSVSHLFLGLFKPFDTLPNSVDAYFSNVTVYEDNSTAVDSTTLAQSNSATTELPLATPYTVTSGTILEFEFLSGSQGNLHSIGWDNNASEPGHHYKLYGTATLPAGYTAADQYTGGTWKKYTLSIGGHLSGSQTDLVTHLVFNTSAGTNPSAQSYFRNVSVREAGDPGTLLSHSFAVPQHSLDAITIDFAKSENQPGTSDDTYAPRLHFKQDGTGTTSTVFGEAGKAFRHDANVELQLAHFGPSALQESGIEPVVKGLDINPGQIVAIGLDANQFSREYLIDSQANLNLALANGSQVSDIDDLLTYAASKYWHELNRGNRIIDGLLSGIGGEQWVGSGIVKADPYLLTDSIPDLNGGTPVYTSEDLRHLQFPILPYNIGVDLPNVNHVTFSVTSGGVLNEAFQLGGYNGSALENAILEDVVNSRSVSTIRGLQDAYAAGGHHFIYIFESAWDATSGTRKFYNRGFLDSDGSIYIDSATPSSSFDFPRNVLTADRDHVPHVIDQIVALLKNENQQYAAQDSLIRILVPSDQSVVGNWAGSVYLAEYETPDGRVGSYIIAPHGGEPSNGGFTGNEAKPWNPLEPLGNPVFGAFTGDPVHVANGNMFRDEVDFTFANPIIPLDFARHYDSQNKLDVGFGVGWVNNFTGIVFQEQDPANANDMDFIWLRGTGERHTFEDTNFTRPNTLFGQVVKTGTGSSARLSEYRDKDGTKYIFEGFENPFNDLSTGKLVYGRLISIQSPTGDHGVNITYESATSVRIAKVESRSVPVRYLQFVYNANGVEVHRYEAAKFVNRWIYTLAAVAGSTGKRLTQVKHANDTTIVTNYEYYTDGPSARKGLIKKITEPNGESHSYEYYANGRTFRVTDGDGNQQSFTYNLFRNLTEFTDENGNVETYIHQNNGLLERQVHNDRSRMQFTWGTGSSGDEYLMATSTDEAGSKETFTYYSSDQYNAGELREHTAKDNLLTRFEYWTPTDTNYRYMSVPSRVIVDPNVANLQTEYTRDGVGNVLSVKDAEGNVTSYEYYDASAPASLRQLRKSTTQPKGVVTPGKSTPEAVSWEVLNDAFVLGAGQNTISVRLLKSSGQIVVADAVRLDRIDDDAEYTRIIDNTTATDDDFRLATLTGTSESSVAGQEYLDDATRLEGSGTNSATWIFRDLLPGKYRISATWLGGGSASVSYQLFAGLPSANPTSTTIENQSIAAIDTASLNDFASFKTEYFYDTAGNVVTTFTEGLPSGFRSYNAYGNVTYEEDATGVARVYEYDALGRLTKSYTMEPTRLNFTERPPQAYTGTPVQDLSGGATVQDDGNTLQLTGNSWKGVALGYNVTANTILEFDLEAPVEGEIHGLWFTHGLNVTNSGFTPFYLGGTQAPSAGYITDYPYEAGSGKVHFRIPIGSHIAPGHYENLLFINDNDGSTSNGISKFSNVVFYEPGNIDRFTSAYDASGRLKTSTDALGRSTSFAYDGNGRLIQTTFADGTFTTHDYDAVGNCIAVTDELGRTTRFVYDDRNRLVQTIYADGTTTRTRYDGAGRVLATIDERGFETKFTYDKVGRLLASSQLQIFNNTLEATPLVATNVYNTLGRLTSVTDPNGNKTTYLYDKLNRVIETRVLDDANASLPPKSLSTTDYDANGNLARTVIYDVHRLFAPTNQGGLALPVPSDHVGVLALADAHPTAVQVTKIGYDALGRLVEVTNADGTKTSIIYDAAGRVRYAIDELGRRTEQKYDQFGRLERIVSPDPDGFLSGQSPQMRYVRDVAGNVSESWEFFGSYNGAQNVEHYERYLYDARNRVTTTIRRDGTRVESVFDAAGQLEATVNALGATNYIEYDRRGRVIATHSADPDGAGPQSAPITRHEYDAAGNIIATIDPVGNLIEFAYDSLNRLRTETSSVLYDIVDNTAPSPRFYVSNGTGSPVPNPNPNAFGGSETEITPDAGGVASAQYYFPDMPAGDYRFLATWTNDSGSPVDGAAIFRINGGAYLWDETGLDFRAAPTDAERQFGEQWNGWEQLAGIRPVTAGDDVAVYLQGSALNADAVRVDRVVSREYFYDKNGNLLNEKDELGRVTAYAYDELNRQTVVQLPDPDLGMTGGGPNNANLIAPITWTVYDGYGNVFQTEESRGTSANTDDRYTVYAYDARNRLTAKVENASSTDANLQLWSQFKYDAVGNLVEETDPIGTVTRYRYDNLDRLVDQYDDAGQGTAAGTAVIFNSAAVQEPLAYLDGEVTVAPNSAAITIDGSAWVIAPMTAAYQADHRTVLEFTLQAEQVHDALMIGFDDNGQDGQVARYFDLGGNADPGAGINTEFRLERLSDGAVRVHVPIGQYLTDAEKAQGFALSHLEFYSYSANQSLEPADWTRVTFSEIHLYQSDERRTVTTFDTRGNVETVREASDPRNIVTHYTYDKLGRQTEVREDYEGPQYRLFRTRYDAVGNVVSEKNVTAGTETRHEYDRLNRLVKTILPDPDGIPTTVNGLVSAFAYDAVGNVVRTTNGEGESTSTTYNELGLAVVETDGNGDQTNYRYDAVGNLLSVTDAAGNTTRYTYDNLDRLRTDQNDFGTRTYLYSNEGNLDRYFDRNGRHIEYDYDSLDRLTDEKWRPTAFVYGGGTNRIVSWSYDKLGRVIKQTDNGTIQATNSTGIADDIVNTFQYDGLGRLIVQANYDPGDLDQGDNNGIPWIKQTYDYVLTRDGAAWHDDVIRSQYLVSGTNELGLAETTYRYDRRGQLANQSDLDVDSTTSTPAVGSKSLSFTYDASGNLSQISRNGAGPVTGYTYDRADRLIGISHGSTGLGYLYGYDRASRITTFTPYSSLGYSDVLGYAYDDAGQLTYVENVSGYTVASYEFDANGNRTSVDGQSLTTGSGNRLTNDGTFTYLYDNEGNLTSRTRISSAAADDQTIEYAWDHRNRLKSATFKNNAGTVTQSITYAYDAEGRLVRRNFDGDGAGAAPATKETYLHDGGELSMTFGNSNQLTHRYLHGPAVDQVLLNEVFTASGGQQVSSDLLWQLADHQNTVRDIVDSSGILRKHVDYDSVGKITSEQFFGENGVSVTATHAEAVDQAFAHTGLWRDEVTNQLFAGARVYDPSTARWLSEDPLGPDASDSPNLYRAFANSWPNTGDPSGLSPQGNPLNNLYASLAGGFSGNKVAPYKPPVSTFNYLDPIGSLKTSFAGVNSIGRAASIPTRAPISSFDRTLGNVAYTAIANSVSPGTKAALGAGIAFASSIPALTQVRSSSPDRYITEFGGQAIPARQQHELPIRVQQAIDAPDRYLVAPHQGQGYMIADPSGAVRYINNDEVLPTSTQMYNARRAADFAKGQELALRIAGEVAISISPAHETSRDLGILFGGYDYYEPNRQITFDDRRAAMMFLAAPGGNSGQLHTGDALIDAVRAGQVYEVGYANSLRKTPVTGTQVHHVPQSRQAESLVGNFNPANRAGNEVGLRLPISEHEAVNAAQRARTAPASARDLLADEIRILRNNTQVPNSQLKQAIELNRQLHRYDYEPLQRVRQ
jgi:RHS repeat-associated protein